MQKGNKSVWGSLLSSADDAKLDFTIHHCSFVCHSKQDVANNASPKGKQDHYWRKDMIRKEGDKKKSLLFQPIATYIGSEQRDRKK